jgi:hypothetical protein
MTALREVQFAPQVAFQGKPDAQILESKYELTMAFKEQMYQATSADYHTSLSRALHREASPGEDYLAWQQGPGGVCRPLFT